MEIAYGILLDQKFMYRCVHAVFANTKWYETWSERTLFVDPIICDFQEPGVLSRMQGQRCDCQRTRHTATGQGTLVVQFSLLFFLVSQVGGWPAARVLPRFSQLPSPTCRGDAANPSLESAFSTHLVVSLFFVSGDAIACDFLSGDAIACASVFIWSGTARARSFCTHQRSRLTNTSLMQIDEASLLGCTARPPLRGLLSYRGTRTTWAMAFPRSTVAQPLRLY